MTYSDTERTYKNLTITDLAQLQDAPNAPDENPLKGLTVQIGGLLSELLKLVKETPDELLTTAVPTFLDTTERGLRQVRREYQDRRDKQLAFAGEHEEGDEQ